MLELLLLLTLQDLRWFGPLLCQQAAPTTLSYQWHGGAKDVKTFDAEPCYWIAVSPQPWISVQGPTSGTSGPDGALVTVVLQPNNGAERTGSITIGRKKIIITQRGRKEKG